MNYFYLFIAIISVEIIFSEPWMHCRQNAQIHVPPTHHQFRYGFKCLNFSKLWVYDKEYSSEAFVNCN